MTTLQKAIRELSIRMVDIANVCDVVKKGYGGDLEMDDYVISTGLYDGSVFQVVREVKRDSRGREKVGEFIENPYTENVVKSEKLNITRKANKDENGWDEKRVKVYKLSLISWSERTQTFPRISHPIVFRQKIIDFKQEYQWEMNTINRILNDEKTTKSQKDDAKKYMLLFDELLKIEPFSAFYDDKYGFLVKREINFTPIVIGKSMSAKNYYDEEIESNRKMIMESNKSKEEFKEQVIAGALHPDRVEYLINKYGIEEGMSTFDTI